MKDFVKEANRLNIHVYDCHNLIQSYSINRHANYVRIQYFGNTSEYKDLDKTDLTELDRKQEQDFDTLKARIISKAKRESNLNWVGVGIYLAGAIFTCHFSTAFLGLYSYWITREFLKVIKPLKLKKEIEITGWIYDHRAKADQIIRQEVRDKVENTNTNMETNNYQISEQSYPYSGVPYSKEMYYDGVNLNNINDINYRELKKLKRKVLKLERRNNHE